MEVHEFLKHFDGFFKQHHINNFCQSIIYQMNDDSIMIDDIKQNAFMYFMEKDRFGKIKKRNGVYTSCYNYLKNLYAKHSKKNKKSQMYWENLLMLSEEYKLKLSQYGFDKYDMKLHVIFAINDRIIKKLGLDVLFYDRNKKPKYEFRVRELIRLIRKFRNINCLELCRIKNNCIRNNKLDKRKFIRELKKIYKIEVVKIFGDKL